MLATHLLPTHFLAMQVSTPCALRALERVQACLLKHSPGLYGSLVDPASAHLTLCVMTLPDATVVPPRQQLGNKVASQPPSERRVRPALSAGALSCTCTAVTACAARLAGKRAAHVDCICWRLWCSGRCQLQLQRWTP